jgi:hypothetical protein
MVRPQGSAYVRINASLVLTGTLSLLAPAFDAIHVHCGPAHVEDVAFEIRQYRELLRLVNY